MNLKNYIRKLLQEIKDQTITCDRCGWEWKKSEGGDDPFTCHKCWNINKPNKTIVNRKNNGKKKINHIIKENDEDLINKTFEQSYDFNSEVLKLQKILTDKKYYIGRYGENKDGIDGKYGPMTQAAHFALKKGLSPDEFRLSKEKLTQMFIKDVSDSTLENEFNFHIIPDGKNNYRSAQLPITLNDTDFLGTVLDKYKIKNVIRLNGDGLDSKHKSSHPQTPINDEKSLVESKGLNFYKLSSTNSQDKVNSILQQGDTLIHCAHGADRTGGNVGGYLYEKLNWSTEKIWDYTTKYNGWERMSLNSPNTFVNGGYLEQAQKFGVKNLSHAQKLTQG